jgi:hypothetical protein
VGKCGWIREGASRLPGDQLIPRKTAIRRRRFKKTSYETIKKKR